jgi:hypothetical protein
VQSVPIISKVVSSNPAHDEVFSVKHYVLKFVSDMRQVGGERVDVEQSFCELYDIF